MHFAENIKFLRTQLGINQIELAEKLGVSQGTVGNWETGAREPELSRIINLSEYFGVTLDDLVLNKLAPEIPMYAKNLAYLRKKQGKLQREIAIFLGVDQKTISSWERGTRTPTIEAISKLADFFGVTMDQIVKQDLSQEVGK